MGNKKIVVGFVVSLFVLIAGIGTILPLFHSGFFSMHDDTQVARVFEMGKSLRDGMFPVRWVSDLGYGYGYPLFNFYGPLAYYVGGLLTLFSFDALISTKMMIGFAMVASGFSMYFLAKSFWGKWGGLLSAVLYLFAPYHAVDLYVRGDIAELFAYTFFPLALLGLWRTYKSPSWGSFTLGAIGFAAVILSHNLSALLFAPFLLIAIGVVTLLGIKNNTRASFYAPFLFLFGILLSCFYTIPVFTEMNYTNVLSQVGGSADFHNHFVCLSQLWQSPWGYGGSAPGCVDGLSFMVGKLQILFGVLALLLTPFLWKKHRENFWIALCAVSGVVASIFLLLPLSQRMWEAWSQMAYLQYPWRYLLLVSLFLSILGGSAGWVFVRVRPFAGSIVVTVLCLFISVFSQKYFVPQSFVRVDSRSYTDTHQLRWVTSKISDEYMPQRFIKPAKESALATPLILSHEGTRTVLSNNVKKKVIQVTLPKTTTIGIGIAYFPTWHATIDGTSVALSPTRQGMQVVMPSGTHTLTIFFQQTPIEVLGDTISLTSIGILVLGIIYNIRKRKLV